MVMNNELKKQKREKINCLLGEEIEEKQKRRIRNVLERGLKKKVLISNTTFDEHDDEIGGILEGNLNYDVDKLVNYFWDLIVMCGSFVKVPNGLNFEGRTIYLGSEVIKSNVDVQGDKEVDVNYYSYLIYPDIVESFLNDLENLDNGYENSSINSILVDFEDKRKYLGYIDFSNCYNIDFSDLNNYVILKYLFSLIKVENIKKYDDNVSILVDRIFYNDVVLGCLKRISTINEASLIKFNNNMKGKVRTKKVNE